MSYSAISDRRPVAGFFADPADLELSGFERHRRSVRRESEPPAVKHLAGLQPTEVSMGRATFSMPASGWLTSPAGFIAPGALAFLADAPLSVAIESVLPPGKTSTTSELSFNFVAPAFSGPGHLVARASVIDVGSRLGFSEAVITDQHGRLVAHATSRCVILDAPELDSRGQRPVDPEWTDTSRPDPWMEEPTGTVDLEIDRRSGLEALGMFVSGELERPPIGYLFGTRPMQVSDGEVIWTAAASPWWSSPAPFVYGGALSVLAEVAHNTAFWTLISRRLDVRQPRSQGAVRPTGVRRRERVDCARIRDSSRKVDHDRRRRSRQRRGEDGAARHRLGGSPPRGVGPVARAASDVIGR